RQGHGGPQYRGEAPAAGWQNPAADRGPRYRSARLVDTDRVRRTDRAAPAGQSTGGRGRKPGPSWFFRREPAAAGPADPTEPRDHPGDRTDGLGQIDDAVRLSEPNQLARKEHHYDRGSDRVPIARRGPDAGEPEDRADVCQRPALDSAPGSRRDHGRRNPRQRNRGDRYSGRLDRPSV